MEKQTVCGGADRLIFACSGGSDIGQLTDLAGRKLMASGSGKMFCLAGVGGRVKGIMDKTGDASEILAIDGCQLDCAKKHLNSPVSQRLYMSGYRISVSKKENLTRRTKMSRKWLPESKTRPIER